MTDPAAVAHDEAYRIEGPAPTLSEPRRVWQLARVLAATDWKVRFFGSALGYVWSLLRPLLLFGILYLVFSEIVGLGDEVVAYPIQLLSAMMLYFFFSEVTGGALTSLVDRQSLVRKIGFPRMVVPLSVGMIGVLNLALNALVLVVFVALQQVEPRWTWLLVPIPVALVALFALGAGLMLSALYVRFRDVRPVWDVATQALFYATPILYPAERIIDESQTLASLAMVNPLAALIQTTRHWLLGPGVPSAVETAGSWGFLLIPAAIFVAVIAGGFWLFERTAPVAAEQL
ncbi:MAG TPA: ABC transporter permease [Solirubrobacteraceae bacterium]|nr:ABC transporter permease [Solirubrobacteraceae bacterium]